MDRGRSAVIVGAIAVLILIGAVVLSYLFLLRRKSSRLTPPAQRIEYWVYMPVAQRPTDKEIMERLLSPATRRRGDPIGAKEGLTLSDVRFHIGVAKKAANPMMLKPHAICEPDAPLPENVEALIGNTEAVARVTFVAEKAAEKRNALQFATHCAEAVAALTGARLVFDAESQTFWPAEALREELDKNADATRFELNVAIRWTETPEMGRAFTRGMNKTGLPDIAMDGVPMDHKTIALYLVEEAARRCWEAGRVERLEVQGFGEVFMLEFDQPMYGVPTHRGWISAMRAMRKIPV